MNWKQAFSIGVIAPGLWDGKGEQWETLYEMVGVYVGHDLFWDKIHKYLPVDNAPSKIPGGTVVRVTINGVSHIGTIIEYTYDTMTYYYYGNMGLCLNNFEDDGGDFCICTASSLNSDNIEVCCREEGYYDIKVERKL